jgi:hypothetical protein
MQTYQIKKRLFRLSGGSAPSFPALATIRVLLLPGQPFGASNEPGLTAVHAVAATVQYDVNTGRHTIKSEHPLQPIHLTFTDQYGRRITVSGRTVETVVEVANINELAVHVEDIYLMLPATLSAFFSEPPMVERVEGELGGVPFRWELAELSANFVTTTQAHQEEMFRRAWSLHERAVHPDSRRLVAALTYYHVACRLRVAGHTPWEFMSEVLLNLSKVLEALFPPGDSGNTRDAARVGLRELGFIDEEIEKFFLPAMALRNEVDVGHVSLALLDLDDLYVLQAYAECAAFNFQVLFTRLLLRLEAGEYDPAPYQDSGPDRRVVGIVNRLRSYVTKDRPWVLARDTDTRAAP